ncbi:1,3-beta-D-glucan synthase [Sorochytrium milnesiophthora]
MSLSRKPSLSFQMTPGFSGSDASSSSSPPDRTFSPASESRYSFASSTQEQIRRQLVTAKHRREHGSPYCAGVAAPATPGMYSFGTDRPSPDASSIDPHSTIDMEPNSMVVPDYDEVWDIFVDLQNTFGFQQDNTRNEFDALKAMVESRASRSDTLDAITTLHAEMMAGEHSNFFKWYFSDEVFELCHGPLVHSDYASAAELRSMYTEKWLARQHNQPPSNKIRDLALWLCIWGEAANLRYCSELVCFLYLAAKTHLEHAPTVTVGSNTFEPYLDHVVRPLYSFVREQVQRKVDGNSEQRVQRQRNHSAIVGYDDINECFWYRSTLLSIKDASGRSILTLPKEQQYASLCHVNWGKALRKTYFEKRSWTHLLVNFSRIWSLHLAGYYICVALVINAAIDNEKKANQIDHSRPVLLAGLSGLLLAVFHMLCACIEPFFVSRSRDTLRHATQRLAKVTALAAGNLVIPVLLFFVLPRLLKHPNEIADMALSIVQLLIGLWTTVYLIVTPLTLSAPKEFTRSWAPLKRTEKIFSVLLWVIVFACKLLTGYYFLLRPFGEPARILLRYHPAVCSTFVCSYFGDFVLAILLVLNFVFFNLDTYMWFTVVMGFFGFVRSSYIGSSVLQPWKAIFARLPERIYSKLVMFPSMHSVHKRKAICAQVWNEIVLSLYQDHLIGIDQMESMLYVAIDDGNGEVAGLQEPRFFINQEDFRGSKTLHMKAGSEAARRTTFFADSLSMTLPCPMSVQAMPTFTVLTPHYSEVILLSLRELIHGSGGSITQLDYLKSIYKEEWDNFIKDSAVYNDGKNDMEDAAPLQVTKELHGIVGFSRATPQATLRTRIWASLRSQTLFRTVSGFMNYRKALRVLGSLEKDMTQDVLEDVINAKFNFVVSVQRYAQLNEREREDLDFLMKTYPSLKVAYTCVETNDNGFERVYSCLIDASCPLLPDGDYVPLYKVELPGPPILGDGKSDNQNVALPYTRGEFLQLIDANQDNFFEESLKVRLLLTEFLNESTANPVAIVGTREFIFSESVGLLGNIAASKEHTFGTITQRVMSKLTSRLHYGHPDFLNFVFMATRGGVSKAQKGLHLNEDIYAGMNAFMRGGRIKHTEYFQCGKGRDLGFTSVLKFVSKIGSGMAEQMISREHYYIGTQLSLGRLLSFYYGHPGFHLNNVFCMVAIALFSTSMFLISEMDVTASAADLVCEKDAPLVNSIRVGKNCLDIQTIYEWTRNCLLGFVIYFVSYLPFLLQLISEQGIVTAFLRLGKQIIRLSLVFEAMVTQTYAYSLLSSFRTKNARYMYTGRSVSTSRTPFVDLYAAFAPVSVYFGLRAATLLLFVTMIVTPGPYYLTQVGFLWFIVLSLILSPFLFNPHQFAYRSFVLDYGRTVNWLFAGNSGPTTDAWCLANQTQRAAITGHKLEGRLQDGLPRASLFNNLGWLLLQWASAATFGLAYLYTHAFKGGGTLLVVLIRISVISVAPFAANAGILLVGLSLSLALGALFSCSKMTAYGSGIAAFVRIVGVVALFGTWAAVIALERWSFESAIPGLLYSASLQNAIYSTVLVLLSRETYGNAANVAWWTGRWMEAGYGWRGALLPLREYVCKVFDTWCFAVDFFTVHLLYLAQFPLCCVPKLSDVHTYYMLLWSSKKRIQIVYRSTPTTYREKIRLASLTAVLVLGWALAVGFALTLKFAPLPNLVHTINSILAHLL